MLRYLPEPVFTVPEGPAGDDALAAVYPWPPPAPQRPAVRVNMIGSLDGGATVAGRSGGLGSSADQRLFAVLRDTADLILVGAGTVLAEGYGGVELDAVRATRRRRWGFDGPTPIAVVASRPLDPDLPLFTQTAIPPLVITTQDVPVPASAIAVRAGTDRVDLALALKVLAAQGFTKLLCEGGPTLLGRLIDSGLVDELCLTISPMILGTGSRPVVEAALREPERWALTSILRDDDHLFTRFVKAARESN